MFRSCPDVIDDVPQLSCLATIIANVINAAFLFLGAVALIILMFGAIKFIFSSGDPKAVGGAKNTMTWAFIGLIFCLLIFAILNFAETWLGLPPNTLQTVKFGQ